MQAAAVAQVRTRRFEAWYISGAIVSGVAYGMLPMLLPQYVVMHGGTPLTAGLVMGSLMLGALFAPIWRGVAERYHIHRTLSTFLVGTAAVTLMVVARAADEVAWIVGAGIVGLACTGMIVVAGLYITDRAPRDDWPKRQGLAVQTFAVGVGLGLLFAAACSYDAELVTDGLVLGAGMLLVATGMTVVWMPHMNRRRRTSPRGDVVDFEGHPVMHQSPDPDVPYREGDTRWKIAFSLFLFGIMFLTLASAAFLFQLPLFVFEVFGLEPAGAALAFGIAALASVIWYPAVGRTARTRDPVDLTVRASWMRALAMGELALLGFVINPWIAAAAAGVLFVYRNTWPSVYAGITECTYELVPPDRRRLAMGILSIGFGIAAVGAGYGSGWFAETYGYEYFIPAVFAVAMVAGLTLSLLRIWRRHLQATAWA